MAAALTGSLGWTGLHPMQLGGAPVVHSWTKTLPREAKPFIAHVYQNDGVTYLGSLGPLATRPRLTAMTANGGYGQLTIEVASRSLTVAHGNVVRLTEQGGSGAIVYSGIAEVLPDTITATQVKHEITLSPFGFELSDTFSQAVYTRPTDISQIVRDAVALTQHCFCDQISVPVAIGVTVAATGTVDFRNQTVGSVIDSCRSMAGPTWFWWVDELGRVWFQLQGSVAGITAKQGIHYAKALTGGGIQNLKNDVLAIGGVPSGGSAPITARYTGTDQASFGVRSLSPPLSIPNITDQVALTFIANNVGAVLDRIWTRVQLELTAGPATDPTPVVNPSQPGGAMLRYFVPVATPIPESAVGSGTYTGPLIVQQLDYDGLVQAVVAGDTPVTSQTDVNNLVASLVSRAAANSLQVVAAALNLSQTLTGTFQSGTGTTGPAGQAATLWRLNQAEFAAIDPNGVTRAEMGNLSANGNSPAQWGFRTINALGLPTLDSFGPLTGGVMSSLGVSSVTGGSTFTTVASADMPGSSLSVTVTPRPLNLLVFMLIAGHVSAEGNTGGSLINPGGAGSPTGSAPIGTAQDVTIMAWEYLAAVPVGTYTFKLQGNISGGGITFTVDGGNMQVWQLGS